MLEADVAVLGGGPGGYVAAIRASQLGGRVILVEKEKVGGICLNKGCIPTKALAKSSEIIYSLSKAKEYGVTVGQISVDYPAIQRRKDMVVETVVKGVEKLLKSNGVKLIQGIGKLLNHEEIEVKKTDGTKVNVQARKIILATGSRTLDPSALGFGGNGVINTDEALELKEAPKSMLVVGAGPSGLEMACIFKQMGSKVTVIEMLPQILPTEDSEITTLLQEALESDGIKIYTRSKFKGIITEEGKRKAAFTTEKGEVTIEADTILMAFGRATNIDDLGLEAAEVKVEKRRIVVINNKMETTTPNIYAIGDAIGNLYAHEASAGGVVAAENAMGKDTHMDYKVVPRCIFTIPEVSAVGLTEAQASEACRKVKVGRFPFTASGRALTLGEQDGLIKIIADSETDEILGMHILGYDAAELVAEAALAIKLECTIDEIVNTIHAHPTLAEAIKEAALDARGEAIHKIKR